MATERISVGGNPHTAWVDVTDEYSGASADILVHPPMRIGNDFAVSIPEGVDFKVGASSTRGSAFQVEVPRVCQSDPTVRRRTILALAAGLVIAADSADPGADRWRPFTDSSTSVTTIPAARIARDV